jgi:diacylglycerol kinase family enzyme
MRIALVHNPDAGDADHSADELARLLEREGHGVRVDPVGENLRGLSASPIDLVLAAGGDGTVRKVALALVGTDMPMSVLALGTANNLARSLGLEDPERTARELGGYEARALDVGLARGDWGERAFVEGFGAGLFADYLDFLGSPEFHALAPEAMREDGVARDLALLMRMLPHFTSRRWDIRADGEDLSGEYFLVEALNIPSIGPFSGLAPEADSSDGALELVLLGEDDRAALGDYLAALGEGTARAAPFSSRRVREIEVRWNRRENLHVDDTLRASAPEDAAAGDARVELSVQPGAARVLCPPARG